MLKLRSYLKRAGKEETGFTLIELMVVVVILGILGSIVVPRIMTNVTTDARANARTANIKMLQAAVDRYAVDTETNHDSIDWADSATMESYLVSDDSDPDWSGPYVDDIPTGYSVSNGIVSGP